MRSISAPIRNPANALFFGRHPGIFLGPRSYILVLSHMRSYSSLLAHVLGSHPEIAGYAEMHLNYQSALDLFRLRARVYRSLDGVLPGRYVLDKVLHNEYATPSSVIRRRNVYPIILLRQAIPSISSVIAMGKEIVEVPWYSNLSDVTDYYVRRVQQLEQLAQQVGSRYLFVRAEDLVGSPELVLPDIASFLGLGQPLTESYSIFPHTAERGWGDSSPAILTGRIDRDRRTPDQTPFDEFEVEPAIRAYDRCRTTLEAHTVFAPPSVA